MTVELPDDVASEKTCESPQTMKLKEEFIEKLQPMEQSIDKSALVRSRREAIESLFDSLVKDLTANSKGKATTQEVIKCPSYTIDKASFQRLRPGSWLNDELINAYTCLINKFLANSTKKMLCLNSFFLTMLEDMKAQKAYKFAKLDRWIRKNLKQVESAAQGKSYTHLFDCDAMLIPINQTRSHWLMMAVDLKHGRFHIINSLGTSQSTADEYKSLVARFLDDYLAAHPLSNASTGKPSEWPLQVCSTTPRQNNGNDCGLCVCLNLASIVTSTVDNLDCLHQPIKSSEIDEMI